MHRVEIIIRNDPRGKFVKDDFKVFGIYDIDEVDVRDIYYLDGSLSQRQVEKIANELLCDPVVGSYSIDRPSEGFEILYNPGVTDPKEDSVKKAVKDLGFNLEKVNTGTEYVISGSFDEQILLKVAGNFLYNPLIQHVRTGSVSISDHKIGQSAPVVISLDADLEQISANMGLSLSLKEMETIKSYFEQEKRYPTDVELETIAQTWSEHCCHKTFLGKIEFEGKIIDNLLKNTIMKATHELSNPICLSVFHDNSGVIDFNEEYGICFKVETHNHPSALEPYGGAATGIGGVIRDILGTGLGAKPVLNTDVFCFGIPDTPTDRIPEGILHPQTIIKGVIRGVRDYGNRMGIPTASGAVYFDEDFLYNPLVYCGCAGLIRKDRIEKKARPGDLVLLVGGRTGRDGIHGVTFASAELSEESEKSCVQIGNPIVEKRVLDCLMRVSETGMINSVTDCGGGGLSSAVGEMGKETGVRIDLEKVLLKYKGLTPREIWISESQERMILAVPSKKSDTVIKEFADEGVEAVAIGEFTHDKRLRLFHRGTEVCNLDMHFLHKGLPIPVKKARRKAGQAQNIDPPKPVDLNSILLAIVGSYNSRSREWIIREYDHEVQGGSTIKPLIGPDGIGHQDAIVCRPFLDQKQGIIIGCGINPSYGRIDAYKMALSVIDEALRNIIAAGGDLHKAALLDNFCFSSPEREEVLGDIVLSSQACYDASIAYGVPFISGKDSLYNEWADGDGKVHQIPPTLLISAIGIVDDVKKCVTIDFKDRDSALYLIGVTDKELGGSEYFRILGIKGGIAPGVDLGIAPAIFRKMHEAINADLIQSCHDLSEGGLGLSICEMSIASNIGVEIDLDKVKYKPLERRFDLILFSESNTRFIAEVRKEDQSRFEAIFGDLPLSHIGSTNNSDKIIVKNKDRTIIEQLINVVKERWLVKTV